MDLVHVEEAAFGFVEGGYADAECEVALVRGVEYALGCNLDGVCAVGLERFLELRGEGLRRFLGGEEDILAA